MGYYLRWPPAHKRLITGILLAGVLLRLAHLVMGDHYPILGADSYYFHHLAETIMSGDDVPGGKSGLAYPLAWAGSVVGMDMAIIILPLICYLAATAVLYCGTAIILGARKALFTLAAFSVLPLSILITAAGYLDRDGFMVIPIASTIFLWYMCRHRTVAALILIGGVETVVLCWAPSARWPILLMVAGIMGFVFLADRREYPRPGWTGIFAGAAGVIMSAAVGILHHGSTVRNLSETAVSSVSNPESIVELTPATITHLVVFYSYIVIPLVIGIIILWKERGKPASMLVLSWLILSVLPGLIFQRVMILTIPPVAITAGIGGVAMYNMVRQILSENPQARLRAIALGMAGIMISGVIIQAVTLGSQGRLAADRDWQNALAYLKYETLHDIRVLSNWDYGYWIIDLAERQPVCAGSPRLADEMEAIFAAEDPQLVYDIMKEYDADVLILDMGQVTGTAIDQLPILYTSGDVRVLAEYPTENTAGGADQGGQECLGQAVDDSQGNDH